VCCLDEDSTADLLTHWSLSQNNNIPIPLFLWRTPEISPRSVSNHWGGSASWRFFRGKTVKKPVFFFKQRVDSLLVFGNVPAPLLPGDSE
jgi:hypothetical protein